MKTPNIATETVGRKWESLRYRPDYRIVKGGNCNKWRVFSMHHQGCETIEEARAVIQESKRATSRPTFNVGGLPVSFKDSHEVYEYRIVKIKLESETIELF